MIERLLNTFKTFKLVLVKFASLRPLAKKFLMKKSDQEFCSIKITHCRRP